MIEATGDLEVDPHHLVEDTGICLGRAFKEALGGKEGIRRYGFSAVPMDEALVTAVVDLIRPPIFALPVFHAARPVGSDGQRTVSGVLAGIC
jgi:imidazoleglycerol-phosphate dehydratase